MNTGQILKKTEEYVKEVLKNAEAGHDWFHIQRVLANAEQIANQEICDQLVVQLAALLHDIADPKFHEDDDSIGPKMTKDFLGSVSLDPNLIDRVVHIVENISFSTSLSKNSPSEESIEFKIVQDADRLDAIGAIGIGRAFHYGGYKNRLMYDPEQAPVLGMSKEAYRKNKGPTLNHFYEKLFLLKDKMHTETAKKMAAERHAYMMDFVERFKKEWEGRV